MHRTIFVILVFIATLPTYARSICTSEEEVVFTCEIEGSSKIASLCAIMQKTKNGKFPLSLNYRFGRPLSPELKFPTNAAGSLEKFQLLHYFRPGLDSTNISFNNGGFRYDIYETIDRESNAKRPEQSAGISVSKSDNTKGAQLSCTKRSVVSHWGLINGSIPCEESDGVPSSCEYNP